MGTKLGRASSAIRLKKLLRALLAVAFVVGISALLGGWVAYAGYAFSALVFLVLLHGALVGQVAPCPSCRAPLGANSDGGEVLQVSDEPLTLHCERCGEYLTLQNGVVLPHAPAITEQPTFKSRVFASGVWPEGCVLCGDRPTRREKLGALEGVPYCGAHSNALSLQLVDDQPELRWRSLPMLRKYLAANRSAG